MSNIGNESNAQYLVGFSAVLPGNELLKKQAILLDHIVCDDLSIHLFREGESRPAREFRDYANAVYNVRVSELLWMRDAELISPLERFAEQISVTKDTLERLRASSRATAAEGLRGQGSEVARALISAYERSMAAHLRSSSIEVVSISRFNEAEQKTTAITGAIEFIFEKMPQADGKANWDGILRLRQDPQLRDVRAELRRFLRRLAHQDLAQAEIRAKLPAIYNGLEELMNRYDVAISYGPPQAVLSAPANVAPTELPTELGLRSGWGTVRTVVSVRESPSRDDTAGPSPFEATTGIRLAQASSCAAAIRPAG